MHGKGLLTPKELDALTEIFESAGMTPQKKTVQKHPVKAKPRTARLKAKVEAAGIAFGYRMGAMTKRPARVKLLSIVRPVQPPADGGCHWYGGRSEEGQALYLCAAAPMVNLVNEIALGNPDGPFFLAHRLTELDHAVFESASRRLLETLWRELGEKGVPPTFGYEVTPAALSRPVEARFELEVASLEKMRFSLLFEETRR